MRGRARNHNVNYNLREDDAAMPYQKPDINDALTTGNLPLTGLVKPSGGDRFC